MYVTLELDSFGSPIGLEIWKDGQQRTIWYSQSILSISSRAKTAEVEETQSIR